MRDAIVVGAGPSGSYLSYLLAKLGYDVLNLEEHSEVGKPVECTGLVSERVFSYVTSKSRINSVSGANVFFPNGKSVHVEKPERTIVIERDRFDREVSAMAIGSGADLKIDSKVISVRAGDDAVQIKYRENGELREDEARVIVGADGINSIVRKELYGVKSKRIVSTYQVDSATPMEDQDSVEVYLGSESTRGFFGWATPAGDLTRIGVGTYGVSPFQYFGRINRRFPKDKIMGITGGAIPIAYLKKTYGKRSMLVGDAAGIVKPLTGGGIYTGVVSSSHAAKTLNRALEEDDLTENNLAQYQKDWKKDLGRELWIDGRIQKYFSSLSDRTLDLIYEAVSRKKMVDLINHLGDIDYPSTVVLSLAVRNPRLLLRLITKT